MQSNNTSHPDMATDHASRFQMLRLGDVMELTSLSRTAIDRLDRDPESGFPARVKLTARTVAWPRGAVEAWIQRRIEASDAA